MKVIKSLFCLLAFVTSFCVVDVMSANEHGKLFSNYNANKKLFIPKVALVENPFTGEMVPYYNAIGGPVSSGQSDHYIASIGNSGTALLSKALAQLEGKSIYATHCHYDNDRKYLLEHPEIKLIIVIRDFRDFMLSRLNLHNDFIKYKSMIANKSGQAITGFLDSRINAPVKDIKDQIAKSDNMPGHSLRVRGLSQEQAEELYIQWQILTPRQKILQALSNDAPYPYGSYIPMYEILLQFQDRPNTHFVKFEDLLNFSMQRNGFTKSEEELIKIGNFLNLELNEAIVREVSKNIMGSTPNYKPATNKVGYWNEIFDEQLVQSCKTAANHLLIKFGYE